PRLPEHFVAAEERQVDAGVARALDVGALLPRPVLVVADREERLRRDGTRQADGAAAAEAIGVDAGPVLRVVAVGLEPADHRVFAVEQPAALVVIARVERTVVADLRRAGRARVVARAVVERAVAVEARAAVGEPRVLVVGLPRRVGGLEEDVGLARIVADTPQLPQSTRPTVASLAHTGWFCDAMICCAVGTTVVTKRAPRPW